VTSPDTIANEIVARMMAIPGMAGLLPNGASYHTATLGSREKAVGRMKDNEALLVWDGMTLASDGEGDVYQHDFRLYVRLSSGSFGAFVTLWHDGIPTNGEGVKLVYTALPSVNERMELMSAQAVVGEDGAEYLEIYFTVMDRQG
jgi:hypothetical protein